MKINSKTVYRFKKILNLKSSRPICRQILIAPDRMVATDSYKLLEVKTDTGADKRGLLKAEDFYRVFKNANETVESSLMKEALKMFSEYVRRVYPKSQLEVIRDSNCCDCVYFPGAYVTGSFLLRSKTTNGVEVPMERFRFRIKIPSYGKIPPITVGEYGDGSMPLEMHKTNEKHISFIFETNKDCYILEEKSFMDGFTHYKQRIPVFSELKTLNLIIDKLEKHLQ